MTAPLLHAQPGAHAAARRQRLSGTVAFYLLASIIVAFLAGSSAPTPLYAVYAARWAFSPITTTVVFGVYALAVLTALLIVGRLSDHIGRRPVLLAALAIQAVTMIVFITADGVPQLLVARIIQLHHRIGEYAGGIDHGAAADCISFTRKQVFQNHATNAFTRSR